MRDKLMGRESADVDIALDNMLGKDFAERVNEYLKAHVSREGEQRVMVVSHWTTCWGRTLRRGWMSISRPM